jgi:copper oxidase (laccase) domain-containing protein
MSKLFYKTSKIKEGNMSFLYGEYEEVLKNRKLFLEKNGISIDQTVSMWLKMTDKIAVVDNTDQGKGSTDMDTGIQVDALITRTKELPLFMITADCLPMIIHDPKKEALALIHGGYPNTDLHLVEKVIKKLRSDYESHIEDFEIIIGPGIQKESYTYDENIFNKVKSDWGKYILQGEDGMYHIDNLGYTIEQIKSFGIKDSQMKIDRTDTFTSSEYFSHARDFSLNQKDRGRFATVCKMI